MSNKDWPEIVVINTYAGSLLVGAAQVGATVARVLEHNDYGRAVRLWNFLETPAASERGRWDEAAGDLSERVVIAHPPCAAFSIAASSGGSIEERGAGVNSPHFDVTRDVLEFTLSRRVRVLLVESVVPTMKGAWKVHDEYARRYGYRLLRVLQNAALFDVPQWRQRFWAVFIRADQDLPKKIPIGLNPRLRALGQLMSEPNPGEPDAYVVRAYERQRRLLRARGLTADQEDQLWNDDACGYGHIQDVVKRLLNSPEDTHALARRYAVFGSFQSNTLWVLDPAKFAPVIMATSYFYAAGRLLGVNEYKAIAGFPRDYLFLGKDAKKFREYLSRGICPPVAAWLLRWALDLCVGELHRRADHEMFYALGNGDVADFNVKKEEALRRLG
jgi:site-specific DNA-cytosine methylase